MTANLKVALVYGNLPTIEEIDQFIFWADRCDVTLVGPESICNYVAACTRFENLRYTALSDYNDNPMYLPGLEKALSEFDIVVVKERLGMYAFQAVKAKWKYRFRLAVWIDNLAVLPGEDVSQMRTVRREVTNAADICLVQTEAAAQVLEVEGVASERIFRFLPGVELRAKRNKKTRAQALAQLGRPEGDIIVVHTGQIEWEEGLLDLVHAFKLACKENARVADRLHFVFCGIGSFAHQLRDTFIQHKLDNRVTYLSPSRDNLRLIYEAADAVFAAGYPGRDRIEGEPYRLLQAMAHEISIISSRTALTEELCGKHRFDFCASHLGSLAEALVRCADSPSLRNDIAKKNAQAYASQYSPAEVKIRMDRLLGEMTRTMMPSEIADLDQQVREVETRVSAKQYLSAIELIEEIFKHGSVATHHKANLLRLVGDCFAKLGDVDAAKDAYIRSLESDQYSARAYIGLGTVGLVKGNHDIAVLHFQKAVTLAPEDEMASLGLGLSFQGMGESKEGIKWVAKALELNPENSAALYTLVRLSYDTNHYAHAERCLSNYLRLHPEDLNMKYSYAGILFKTRQFDAAKSVCQGIIKSDPLDSRAHSLMKQINMQTQKHDSAVSNE